MASYLSVLRARLSRINRLIDNCKAAGRSVSSQDLYDARDRLIDRINILESGLSHRAEPAS
ncbi:hypothetical protein [Alterisphingorhabdus coralli]|uniref:Uncharacterized protein n=1 Tax=Alterisphingorhabdus coralli TaxID=3071408 RepID=A0AA97F7Y5_9SPHN|nr:hypothetical protein [Parasphingorhabdus sp. SCSIO 66989]WOE74947.1 hypothetical protein RB602_14070 [Parasphingorhabdus sp. SCSIO 66989]